MKYVRLACNECGKEFDKPKNEYTRRIRKGIDKFFCSRICGATHNNRITANLRPNSNNLIADNRRDEFTPFKWYLRRIHTRAKKKKYKTDITLEYLKALWVEQGGICPLTGWQLVLPHDCDIWAKNQPY